MRGETLKAKSERRRLWFQFVLMLICNRRFFSSFFSPPHLLFNFQFFFVLTKLFLRFFLFIFSSLFSFFFLFFFPFFFSFFFCFFLFLSVLVFFSFSFFLFCFLFFCLFFSFFFFSFFFFFLSGRTGKKRCYGHKSWGQYVAVLFRLQLTSYTVKPLETFSNPFNKARGIFF